MERILLKNTTIINNDCSLNSNQDIYIENGKILSITQAETQNYADCKEIDCTNYYITPSFVNLHAHAAMNIFKGIAEDVTIDDWFNKEIFPYESKLNEEDVYYGALLAALEMLENGVTIFADHYFMQEAVLKAVLDSGIRANIAPTVFGLSPNYKEQLDNAKKFIINNKHISNKVSFMLGPHAPYTCPNPILKEIVDTAKQINVGINLHVSETKQQVLDSYQNTNKSPFEVLYDSGAFDIDLLIAHGLWIQSEDTKYINEKTWFAFCPKTYMKLAMGQGNICFYKDRLNYSFGTDGAASSNTLSPLEQARLFALNGKLILNNSTDLKISYIWKKLMNGHKAFSFNTGEIKKGYNADLIIWDLNKLNTMPIYNPVASILYSSDASNVLYTMVEGEFVKYNGKLVLNEKNILNKIPEIQASVLNRGKGIKIVNY